MLTVLPFTVKFIYAIGSLQDGTLDLIAENRKISIQRCVLEKLHR